MLACFFPKLSAISSKTSLYDLFSDEMIKRLKDAGKKRAGIEGRKIAVELIQQLREIEGVRGVHVMAIEWEERVPGIVEKAGLLPRPSL